MTIAGKRMAWGVKPEWAGSLLFGVPQGASVVRVRFRANQFATAFVKHGGTLTKHFLELVDGGVKLGPAVGLNAKEGARG